MTPRKVEPVDHAIIANTQSEPVRAGHPIMWKCVEPQAHRINLPLDIGLDGRRHLQKIAVEFA